MNKITEIIHQFKVEADEILFEDLNFDSRLKEKVRKQLKSNEAKNAWLRIILNVRRKWAYGIVAVAVLSILVVIGTSDLRKTLLYGITTHNSENKTNSQYEQFSTNTNGITGLKPAPRPFAFPIEIVAESYPVHPNQTLAIKPKGKDWNGRSVKLYYLPESDSNDDELLYKKVLPTNAKYIGETSISNGKWSFEWQAPNLQNEGRYGSFLVAALSDDGTLSGVSLITLLYDKLEIRPSTVKVGQKFELIGSGFPAGDVRIDILKNNDDVGTVFQTTLGMLHSTNGSFSFSFELSPKLNGYDIIPGLYQVQAVIIPPNQPSDGVFVNLNIVQ